MNKQDRKPLILVTNDDGITAPGIRKLVEFMNEIGEVVVVAPDSPQSGKGHAITINSTLMVEEIKMEGAQRDYACSGTPVDCVKLALDKVLPRRPDLVVSGINHGANSSINVIYSGTMSAAVEAGVEGIPAIGFSLLDFSFEADFDQAKDFIQEIVFINLSRIGVIYRFWLIMYMCKCILYIYHDDVHFFIIIFRRIEAEHQGHQWSCEQYFIKFK